MNRRHALLLAFCSACATTPHTRVLVPYTLSAPIERVSVEAVNATGSALPMPPASIVEQAVRLVTKEPEPESGIIDAFARAATARLADMHVRGGAGNGPRLRIRLTAWDVRGGSATGAVVAVGADYELLGAHGEVLWHARQEHLPVRLGGPNLSRYEVEQVAGRCVDRALASWPRPGVVPPR